MKKNIEKILFLDIETVRGCKSLDEADERSVKSWINSMSGSGDRPGQNGANEDNDYKYNELAGLYPFFGKIVCLSVGWIEDKEYKFNSFCNKNEHTLLNDFANVLGLAVAKMFYNVCGHNIKAFDIPYITKRMIINKIKVPALISTYNKKPWETNFEDTYEIMKCNGYNSGSLDQIANVLGIESPKEGEVSGKTLSDYYYSDHDQCDIEKIKEYCERDVETTMKVYQRIMKYI